MMIKLELEQLFQPLLEDLGFELWGCEYLSQGKYSTLRLYIDKPDGINIKDCERVSKQVSALLDVEDPIAGHYTLEVSSPGIPKPLFYPWQYQRYIGSEITIKTKQPVRGKRKFSGTIIDATDSLVKLNIELEQEEILFSNVVKAHLTV